MTRQAVAAGLVLLSLAAGPALAMSAEEARARIEAAYPVQVLRVAADELDGRPAYRMAVMDRAGGDRNGAFAVSQIFVDQETGQILSLFRHTENGALGPAPPPGVQREGQEAASGGRSWR
ncbi:MAG: hypothetical protein OHK0024_04040 [Thalassobaculales bacterium]